MQGDYRWEVSSVNDVTLALADLPALLKSYNVEIQS